MEKNEELKAKNEELKAKIAAAENKLAFERRKADRTDWIGNDPPDRQ